MENRNLPRTILREVRKVVNGTKEPEYGVSDFLLLLWIAEVSGARGRQYGKKAVESAIRASNIGADIDPVREAIEIRKAFGTFGCPEKTGYASEDMAKEANLEAK